MAETQRSTNSSDAGNVTGSSSKAQRARGVSDAPVVNPKINRDDFLQELDALVGAGRIIDGCSIGLMVSQLDEQLRNKLNEIFMNERVLSSSLADVMRSYGLVVSSSDVLRRHRRRLNGKEGCKCPIPNAVAKPK
jgi:hypothetical protein